jgi:hypothetical protein
MNDLTENPVENIISPQDDVGDYQENVSNDVDYKEAGNVDPLQEIEREALNVGWKPKDQFEGDPNDWSPAHKFLLNKVNIFKEEKKRYQKANKAMSNLLELQGKTHTQQKEALQKQLDNAILQKELALNEYDTDTVREKDREIKEAETALRELKDPSLDIKETMANVAKDFSQKNPQIFNSPKDLHNFTYFVNEVENEMRQNGVVFISADEIEEVFNIAKKRFLKENPYKDAKPVAAGIPSKSVPAKGSTEFDRLTPQAQKDIKFIVKATQPKLEVGSTEFKKECVKLAIKGKF